MDRECTPRARDSRVGPSLPSTTIARTPSLVSQAASMRPVGPAPTTSTSASRIVSSAMAMQDGASVSSTTVPPAATAAAVRASSASCGTHRSMWKRCLGGSCGSVCWNHRRGTRPPGSATSSPSTAVASPVSRAAQNGPMAATSAVSRASSTTAGAAGSAGMPRSLAIPLIRRARSTSRSVTPETSWLRSVTSTCG